MLVLWTADEELFVVDPDMVMGNVTFCIVMICAGKPVKPLTGAILHGHEFLGLELSSMVRRAENSYEVVTTPETAST